MSRAFSGAALKVHQRLEPQRVTQLQGIPPQEEKKKKSYTKPRIKLPKNENKGGDGDEEIKNRSLIR
jgi:hypothetical protein